MGENSEFFQVPIPVWGKELRIFSKPRSDIGKLRISPRPRAYKGGAESFSKSKSRTYSFRFLTYFSIFFTYSCIYSTYSFIFPSYLLHQRIPECDVIRGGVLANPESRITPKRKDLKNVPLTNDWALPSSWTY